MDSSSSRTRIPLSFHVDRVAKRIAQLAPKLRSEGSLGKKEGEKNVLLGFFWENKDVENIRTKFLHDEIALFD